MQGGGGIRAEERAVEAVKQSKQSKHLPLEPFVFALQGKGIVSEPAKPAMRKASRNFECFKSREGGMKRE